MSKEMSAYEEQDHSTGDNEVNPYFRIVSGNALSSSGLGIASSMPRPSTTFTSTSTTAYQGVLGRDEGSYGWYRLEQTADDAELQLEEGHRKSAKSDEKKKATFFEQSSSWMQKYVSSVKKQSDIISSTSPTWLPEEVRSIKVETSDASPRIANSEVSVNLKKPAEHQTCSQGVTIAGRLGSAIEVTENSQVTKAITSRRAVIQKTLEKFKELLQYFESKPETTEQPKRHRWDMKTATYMREKRLSLEEDIIGEVEGVEVGDSFSWRAEMSVIGLHKELVAGINVVRRPDSEGGPIATSVVFGNSGSYSDNIYKESDSELSIYSGQGGLPRSRGSGSKGHPVYKDQTLTGSNLALKRSADQKIPIRVIKGVQKVQKDDKKYVYDGLYEITDCKFEAGVHGNKVYKFMLRRLR